MTSIFVKPANSLKAGLSYLRSSFTGNIYDPPMPLFLSAELTNYCNLRCPECLSGSGKMKRERGFMDYNLYQRIISELSPYIYSLNLYFQGEPMMHPDFFSFLVKEGSYRIIVSTNGHFLTPENAVRIVQSDIDVLIVSLDGMDQKAYSAYRRKGELIKVISGIKNVSLAKKRYSSRLRLVIQFLVNKQNEHQIRDVRKLAHDTGASLRLKSMQIIKSEDIETWQPTLLKFRRYISRGGEYRLKNRLPNRCARLWFNPVITWDGLVVPCCFDKDAHYVMGDLKQDDFRTIWSSDRYKEFRRRIITDRNSVDICRNCTSGLKGVHY